MSDKNKSFRSHCDVDVLLDKETDTVSVTVSYKPEMFKRPLGLSRYRYFLTDVKEELERQGILIGKNDVAKITPSSGVIDNTSRFPENHSLSATFKIISPAPRTSTKKDASPVIPPSSSTSTTKKTIKTSSKTTNK